MWTCFWAVGLVMGAPDIATFDAPGYGAPVAGAWYAPGEGASPLPLGGLGTGFVGIDSRGRLGPSTAENNWLNPADLSPGSGLVVRVGGQEVSLLSGGAGLPDLARFWGHFPMADIDFGKTFPDVTAHLRAFSPVIPHDYEASGMPVALFNVSLKNESAASVPVELALQWQAPAEPGRKAAGNVEGALGWRRPTLGPGETWRVAPTVVFARGREEAVRRARSARPDGAALASSGAPPTAGHASYRSGDVTEFVLDAWGGVNWEDLGEETALYDGVPNVGQLFWRLGYQGGEAGRGAGGAFGLEGTALPARTLDGALRVELSLQKAGADSVALVFAITNQSGGMVRNLQFGYALNADIGGPQFAEKQRAEYVREAAAILFEQDQSDVVVALAGDAPLCFVGTYPAAHEAMTSGNWIQVDTQSAAPNTRTAHYGIQMDLVHGSYAVGAADTEPWKVEAAQITPDTIRTTVRHELAPGEEAQITLGLAWFFPFWTSSDGERLKHRYAKDYLGAADVLDAAIAGADDLERRIVAWQETIYGSPAPPLLKDAVINSLYIWPRNSWWIDDGRFFQSESFTGCPITETFVCRFYGSFPLALMFPELERATMKAIADAQAETGEIPFAMGLPAASRSPYYQVQHPIVSSEYALTTYRNWMLWKDDTHLAESYPSAKKAIQFAMTLDADGDGLVNEDPGSETGFPANQYYDCWPWWGTSAYTGSIWLAALRAGERMAEAQNDTEFAVELAALFDKGAKAFEEMLWTGSHYRLYNDPAGGRSSDTSLANALCGQWFAYACGLGEIVPKERINQVIDTVFRLNVASTPYGAVNGVRPDGSIDTSFANHSAALTLGEVWCFCAMAAWAGRTDDAVSLFNTSYGNILLNQKTPWNLPWSLDPATGAVQWGVHYYSNPCVWTLLQALTPEAYVRLGNTPG